MDETHIVPAIQFLTRTGPFNQRFVVGENEKERDDFFKIISAGQPKEVVETLHKVNLHIRVETVTED